MLPHIALILFPTDLTPASRRAYAYALALAEKFDAEIILLHVMEEGASGANPLKGLLGEERLRQLKEAQAQQAQQMLIGKKREGALIREALGAFAARAEQKLAGSGCRTAEVAVVSGNPVDEILHEAAERHADLIVMGYHARGKLQEALLGSTTKRVLRRSRIPVLLVRLEPDRG